MGEALATAWAVSALMAVVGTVLLGGLVAFAYACVRAAY